MGLAGSKTGAEKLLEAVAAGKASPRLLQERPVEVRLAGSKLTDEQYASFKSGNLYVNVHTAEHKPGEIRAQLKP